MLIGALSTRPLALFAVGEGLPRLIEEPSAEKLRIFPMMRQLFLLVLVIMMAFQPAFGQNKIAIVNVTVIDGTDHPPRKHFNVIVQGTKIVSMTAAAEELPAGTTIFDGTGKFLIPGLWNNDLHGPAYDQAKVPLASLVSYGVTTVRDMGAPLDDILRIRAATASGTLLGPQIFVAGPLMEGPTPIKMGLIVDLFSDAQAREEVGMLKEQNVDYVEVDTTLTPNLYWVIADEAKRQGLPLVGHIPARISAWDMAKADQIDVEHLGGRFFNVLVACSSDEDYFMKQLGAIYGGVMKSLNEKKPFVEPQFTADFDRRLLDTFDENKAQKLFHLYAQNGIAQTPTLYVLKTLWDTNKDNNHLTDRDMQYGRKIFAKDLAVIGEMKRDGVPILAGTDGPYPQGGESLHSELELLVEAGLTPLQALQAASRDAAMAMGVSKQVGTIEVGKTADLVLLNADPLQDISNTRKIDAVVLRGHLFSADELSAMRSH